MELTERQQYYLLPADTNHPGHPGNELGQNPEAAAAYWYKRANELADENRRNNASDVRMLDNGNIEVIDCGVSGVGKTEDEAWAYVHAFHAADHAVPPPDDPQSDEEEDERAERRDQLASTLFAVIRSYIERKPGEGAK